MHCTSSLQLVFLCCIPEHSSKSGTQSSVGYVLGYWGLRLVTNLTISELKGPLMSPIPTKPGLCSAIRGHQLRNCSNCTTCLVSSWDSLVLELVLEPYTFMLVRYGT